MRTRWLGINGFEFLHRGRAILLDPYVTRNAAKVSDPAAVAKRLPRADIVFVGHSHWDHLGDVPALARQTGCLVVGSRTTLNICRHFHIPETQLREFRSGERLDFGDFAVDVADSRHMEPCAYPGHYPKPPERLESIADYLEGGTFALRFDFGEARVLNLGSANLREESLRGLDCDCLIAGISKRSLDFLPRLLGAVKTKLTIPSHFDHFETPFENPGERTSLAEFRAELAALAPDIGVFVPTIDTPFDIAPHEGLAAT